MTGERASSAFGAPGIAPTWSSSDKDFVTASLGSARLWATVGHGVLNEVYWPSTGEPRLRDCTFYLVGPSGWIDLKRVRRYRLATPDPAIPLLTVTHVGEDYSVSLEVLPDPDRDVLLVRYRVTGPYGLVVIAAPHLDDTGRCERAWSDGDLFATAAGAALCVTASPPLSQKSVGYVGASDGWQDLERHGRLIWSFAEAPGGNVALTAALGGAEGTLALGFDQEPIGARTLARAALADGAAAIRARFLSGWRAWAATIAPAERCVPAQAPPALAAELHEAMRRSACILKVHEDRDYPGALVASLSVPWGSSTHSLGGYHLVWPRDATLAAFGLIVVGQIAEARRILALLSATQAGDGHWPQNFYPSGLPYWSGIQLDEAAFPVLLAAKLREMGEPDLEGTAAMARAATAFVARNGPASPQDRWEETPGINPFTLAVAVAALVAAEPWLAPEEAEEALDIADDWRARLDGWCWVDDSHWTRTLGVAGHYIRTAPAEAPGDPACPVLLRNRPGETIAARDLVSMEFSYLPRLGLMPPDDPRLRKTALVVDAVLAVPTPAGRVFHRYNGDGYGETEDGGPFTSIGTGRAWPLLVGERGHLAVGLGEDPLPYLRTMLRCASDGGLMPEQVWDAPPIPERGLAPGRPSGSAMPLLWAHAEYLKLLAAADGRPPVERLASVAGRYREERPPRWMRWREGIGLDRLPAGTGLSIEGLAPFSVHLGLDGWERPQDLEALRRPFGIWAVRLPAERLAGHGRLVFTRRLAGGWEGADHEIRLTA